MAQIRIRLLDWALRYYVGLWHELSDGDCVTMCKDYNGLHVGLFIEKGTTCFMDMERQLQEATDHGTHGH